MRRIDLHAHTIHSDGTVTPTQLVERAASLGLVAVAITDHDTLSGVLEAKRAGEALGIEVIAGCEISANLDGTSVHVLGHGMPDDAPGLEELLVRVRSDRNVRNERILERLADLGCPIEMAHVTKHAEGDVVARPHVARALVEQGFVRDEKEAFDRYLKDGGPAHVVVERCTPEEAVGAIRAAGGAASIAHPRQLRLPDRRAWAVFLERLVRAGLAGFEVQHPSHRPSDRTYFGALADEFGLVKTGGSDFHGTAKPDRELGRGDGTIAIGYEVWDALRARCVAPGAS